MVTFVDRNRKQAFPDRVRKMSCRLVRIETSGDRREFSILRGQLQRILGTHVRWSWDIRMNGDLPIQEHREPTVVVNSLEGFFESAG
jgi:hypothetical protein